MLTATLAMARSVWLPTRLRPRRGPVPAAQTLEAAPPLQEFRTSGDAGEASNAVSGPANVNTAGVPP